MLTQLAVSKAYLRHQETLCPVPLFVDPYAACYLPLNIEIGIGNVQHHHLYCLATKFIDDQLVETLKNDDGIKQVVLLTDGMDTRSYRISGPVSTVISDASQEVGAKVSKSCLLLHAPLKWGNLQLKLRERGFNGIDQGLPITTLTQLEDILMDVNSLAVEGCLLLCELPAQLAETESHDGKSWLEKVLLRHGFRVLSLEITNTTSNESLLPCYKSLLFVGQHLRLL